jgi:hypothetical protein
MHKVSFTSLIWEPNNPQNTRNKLCELLHMLTVIHSGKITYLSKCTFRDGLAVSSMASQGLVV